MPKKKDQPKPLFAVKHDFADSLEAFIQASILLHTTVTTILSLTGPGEPVPAGVRVLLQERADAWERAALVDHGAPG